MRHSRRVQGSTATNTATDIETAAGSGWRRRALSSMAALGCWGLLVLGCSPANPPLDAASSQQAVTALTPTLVPRTIDPCSLVTAEEAANLLGAPVASITPFDANTSCTYDAAAEDRPLSLTVVIRQPERPGDTVRGFESYQGDSGVSLDGIGDRAFIRGDEINVLKNEIWVEIFTSRVPEAGDALTTIAEAAAARL